MLLSALSLGRLEVRSGHFMPAALLASQLATLERDPSLLVVPVPPYTDARRTSDGRGSGSGGGVRGCSEEPSTEWGSSTAAAAGPLVTSLDGNVAGGGGVAGDQRVFLYRSAGLPPVRLREAAARALVSAALRDSAQDRKQHSRPRPQAAAQRTDSDALPAEERVGAGEGCSDAYGSSDGGAERGNVYVPAPCGDAGSAPPPAPRPAVIGRTEPSSARRTANVDAQPGGSMTSEKLRRSRRRRIRRQIKTLTACILKRIVDERLLQQQQQ